MPDFTSSLYLGLHHASHTLRPWPALTQGRPAALQEFEEARAVAQALAALTGREAGALVPSTFQLFWDVLGVLSRDQPIEVFMDAATYPIARWGAACWAGRGMPLRVFRRHDADHLAALMRRPRQTRAVVLADAVNPAGVAQPPLHAYSRLVQRQGGWLLLDDTQGLGLLGRAPCPRWPYGRGGGGSLLKLGLEGDHLLVGSSLAKAFGVPVAVLAGPAAWLQRFERLSAARQHMSPPSMAVVRAAEHALRVNRLAGDALREILVQRVRRLRHGLARHGIATDGGDFPLQTLRLPHDLDVGSLHRELMEDDVATVMHRRAGHAWGLSLLLNAGHRATDVDTAVDRIATALRTTRRETAASPDARRRVPARVAEERP